jgi:hypothetical protein
MRSRRDCLAAACSLLTLRSAATAGTDHLPRKLTFQGGDRYARIMARARREQWDRLPIGPRMSRLGLAFLGVPYAGNTLEIDDRTECPSVNCEGLDCWTFFECVMGMARQLERPGGPDPAGLLREIEWTRYRGGHCHGNYLDRIHYLNEWFIDNEARGNVRDITRSLPGAERLRGRRSSEMSESWKSYRYLRADPSLVPKLAASETAITALPVWYIPTTKVAAVESLLADGDIAGIVTRQQGVVCSHVGLISRDETGRPLFLHASRNFRRVTTEGTLSTYLRTYRSHAGVIIARPRPLSQTITDERQYRRNLRKLSSGT